MALSEEAAEVEALKTDFSYTSLSEDLILFKNKGILIEVLHKLNHRMLNQLCDINDIMKPLYKNELKKVNKKKKFKKDTTIQKVLYNLQMSTAEFDYEKGFGNISKIFKSIEDKTISVVNGDLNNIHSQLSKSEKEIKGYPLIPSYIRGYLYKYMKEKKMKTQDILKKFQISRRLFYYYTSFFELINKYNFLIKIDLTFSSVVKYLKEINVCIQQDAELENLCKTELNFAKILKQHTSSLSELEI